MNHAHLTPRSLLRICSGLVLLLSSGCSTGVTPSVAAIRELIAYEVERSPAPIDASATIEARVTQDESIRNHLRQTARYSELGLANHPQALAETLTNDLVNSGLFTRILPVGDTTADYHVIIRDDESRFPAWIVRVSLRVIDAKTGQEVSSHSQEVTAGMTPYQKLFPGMMTTLKARIASDLLANVRQKRERDAKDQAAMFAKLTLAELLAASDKWVALARERNRAIVTAKNEQLPAILRGSKTDELSALVVKIELTILDLNHESEVAKDRAQQATATGGDSPQTEELRGLNISYRERIELLKPILAALKEEIANRNR